MKSPCWMHIYIYSIYNYNKPCNQKKTTTMFDTAQYEQKTHPKLADSQQRWSASAEAGVWWIFSICKAVISGISAAFRSLFSSFQTDENRKTRFRNGFPNLITISALDFVRSDEIYLFFVGRQMEKSCQIPSDLNVPWFRHLFRQVAALGPSKSNAGAGAQAVNPGKPGSVRLHS